MDFLLEESTYFDKKIDSANIALMEAVTVSLEINEDNIFMTEKSKETLSIKFKKFIADVITAIRKIIDELSTRVKSVVRDVTFKAKLLKYREELKNKGSLSMEKVIDVWKLTDIYLEMNNELTKYARRISKMNYTSLLAIDRDIDSFDAIIDKYEKSLTSTYEKKVLVSSKTMLDFVEDELSGRSSVLKVLNDSISLFEQMDKECDRLFDKANFLGKDITHKKIGFIKRGIYKISATIKKWAVRIISGFVFLFA